MKIVFDSFPKQTENETTHPINNPLAISYFIGAAFALSGIIPISIFCIMAYKHPVQSQDTPEMRQSQVDEVTNSFDVENDRHNTLGEMMHDIELEDKTTATATVNVNASVELSSEEEEDEETLIKPPLWKKIAVCCLTAFALFNYVGAELGFGSLVVTYIHKSKIASDSEAFLLNSAFWLSFTVFRFGGVILSAIFTDSTLLIMDVIA